MSKYKFTNRNSVSTYSTINGNPSTKSSYSLWKRLQENVHADDRWVVHPDFLDYGSFDEWYKKNRFPDVSSCVMVYSCVGFDDFNIGPATSALLPRGVAVIIHSMPPGSTPETVLDRLRKAITKYAAGFNRIPHIRQMLWNYRFETKVTETEKPTPVDAVSEPVENPLTPIAKAIAEAVQFQYDQLSDDLLFQLYFDNQPTLVPQDLQIRIPGWPHRYPVILELVKSIPAPPPVIKEPLTIEEQVVELSKDLRTVSLSVEELDDKFDKLVAFIKPSTVTQAVKDIQTLKSLTHPDAIRSMVKDLQMVKIAVRELETLAQKILNESPNAVLAQRMHQLETLVMEHITQPTPSIKVEPRSSVIPDHVSEDNGTIQPFPTESAPSTPTPIAKALQSVNPPTPEVVIVGLAPDNAARIAKDYHGKVNTIILPLNVNPKRLKAVCKGRRVILMTAFASHAITNAIKSVTDNVITIGNGMSSLHRELDALHTHVN